MTYIQRKEDNQLETVDQFDSYREAKEMIKEYWLSDPYAIYYLSSKACRAWNDGSLSE